MDKYLFALTYDRFAAGYENLVHGMSLGDREKNRTVSIFIDVGLSVRLLFAVNGKKEKRQIAGGPGQTQPMESNSDAAVRENLENAGI